MDFRQHWKLVFDELFSQGLSHGTIEPYATYSPWLDDVEFNQLLKQVMSHTLVDVYRLWELKQLSKDCHLVPGDILEVGVWRGGSGAILCAMSPQKKVWLADTFHGVVNQSEIDLSYNGGEHSDTSEEIVLSLLSKLELENFEICKGVFPDDTGQLIPKLLSFVHIDVDVYESAKAIWFFVENRVSIGGIVVFDDYGFSSTSGVTLFVNEIRANPNYKFVYNLNGHAIFIRIY